MLILPEELVAEIISRIPAKSVIRFKCVSKAWCTLINDPSFGKLHFDRSIISNLLLVTEYYYCIDGNGYDNRIKRGFPFQELLHPSYIEMVGYCNGLVCLYGNNKNLILWNPFTREYQKLPYLFPPKVSILDQLTWGFGFHPKTNEYKVVRIAQVDRQDESEVQVYTIGSGSWRKLENIPYRLFPEGEGLVDGVIHWITTCQSSILSFNFEDEQFRQVPLPVNVVRCGSHDEKWVVLCVGVVRGCLSMVGYRSHYEIWVMKDYGVKESWTKTFNISPYKMNLKILYRIHYSSCGFMRLFGNGEILLRSGLGERDQLFLYSPENETTRSLYNGNIDKRKLISVERFVKSLISPKQIENRIEKFDS